MSSVVRSPRVQGGREISSQDLEHIGEIVRRFPKLSRNELADTICEHLEWLTASGMPKTTACLKLLLRLEGEGEIVLPGLKPELARPKPMASPRLTKRTEARNILDVPLKSLAPIGLISVSGKEQIKLWNEYIERFHPLKHKKPFGNPLRYFIESDGERLGCLLMAGPAKSMTARDQWIGWTNEVRLKNLPWLINNSRYLIFPWVKVPHLASHVLGRLAKRVADDWEERWGYRPLLMETFVDPEFYNGVCYRAAGWECLGRTTGEGLLRPGKQYKTTQKLIFVKPLASGFQKQLCSDSLQGRVEF